VKDQEKGGSGAANKSLDASGGREVIADFQLPIADLIRAAASTQPFGCRAS